MSDGSPQFLGKGSLNSLSNIHFLKSAKRSIYHSKIVRITFQSNIHEKRYLFGAKEQTRLSAQIGD